MHDRTTVLIWKYYLPEMAVVALAGAIACVAILAVGQLQRHRESVARDEVRDVLQDMLANGDLTRRQYDAMQTGLDRDEATSR